MGTHRHGSFQTASTSLLEGQQWASLAEDPVEKSPMGMVSEAPTVVGTFEAAL